MIITRRSLLTGTERTRDIDITQRQLDSWRAGVTVQKAMANLSEEDREFVISGITPEEWQEYLSDPLVSDR